MAVNDSRSMNGDFHHGVIDNTYIALVPNRGNVEIPPYDRLTWPTYAQVEKHVDPPFIEAHLQRSVLPREARNGDQDPSGDPPVLAVADKRRMDAFLFGTGVDPEKYCCVECGYESASRKNFRRTEDGEARTCSTGHYEKDGELKRQKNAYARGR